MPEFIVDMADAGLVAGVVLFVVIWGAIVRELWLNRRG